MTIKVRITQNYECRAVYPVCEKALKLAELAGHTTLTPSDIETIKALGYTIEVVQAVVSL